MVSYAKYSLVPTEEPKEIKKPDPAKHAAYMAFDYSSAFTYKSAFDYNPNNSQYQSAFDYGYGPKARSSSLGRGNKGGKVKKGYGILDCISTLVTWISYFIIGITFPCTLWFCLKRLQQWERLIIFRLGRLHGVFGPGVVFIIPWLDRHTRVDLRTKAFSVPPQQLITADNGIIEMGCEVKYRVTDVQQLTTSVTSPQHGLRSFGKTVLLNVLTKHTVKETEKDRVAIAAEMMKELNARVQDWGVEIGEVDLSNVNILKEPEPNDPLKPLMSAFSNATGAGSGPPPVIAPMPGMIPPASGSGANSNSNSGGGFNLSKIAAGLGYSFSGGDSSKKKQQQDGGKPGAPRTKLGKYIQSMVSGPGGADLTHGTYRLQVEGRDGGVFTIFITGGCRQVMEGDVPKMTPDVNVTISKEDLHAIFNGSLAPLQAYLSGHLTVQGNIQMLMGLESLRQTTQERDDIFIV